jgi:hypothetical protein
MTKKKKIFLFASITKIEIFIRGLNALGFQRNFALSLPRNGQKFEFHSLSSSKSLIFWSLMNLDENTNALYFRCPKRPKIRISLIPMINIRLSKLERKKNKNSQSKFHLFLGEEIKSSLRVPFSVSKRFHLRF